ncbi:prion-inhibition and propagation-domain-containing protein [Trichophaea hybrida]|nr:prion-inhibition and propagation-domain-containing protein [Trichophaea hybrida]
MAIDPIGLTFGLASLPGLLTACLDILDRISTAKSYDKDYRIFRTKVETERLRLLLWGQAVGLAPSSLSPSPEQLQDPRIRKAVCELLTWAIQLFEDEEVIRKRYISSGTSAKAFVTYLPGRNNVAQMVAVSVDYPCGRAKGNVKTSAMTKMKWAISGKKKLEKLLGDLSWFVDKLHELVSISGTRQLTAEIHQMMPAVSEIPSTPTTPEPLPLLRPTTLAGKSAAEHRGRRMEFRIRRTRKHAMRIAVGTEGKLKQIRVDER